MSDLAQLRGNVGTMKDFAPLTEKERRVVEQVTTIFHAQNLIPCTACRYCVDGCPKHIAIPDLFSCMNSQKQHGGWNAGYYYGEVYTKQGGKTSECGKCGAVCPQHLYIRDLLVDVAKTFEN